MRSSYSIFLNSGIFGVSSECTGAGLGGGGGPVVVDVAEDVDVDADVVVDANVAVDVDMAVDVDVDADVAADDSFPVLLFFFAVVLEGMAGG